MEIYTCRFYSFMIVSLVYKNLYKLRRIQMYSEPYIVALDPGNAWIKVKVGDREIDIYENIYSFRDD